MTPAARAPSLTVMKRPNRKPTDDEIIDDWLRRQNYARTKRVLAWLSPLIVCFVLFVAIRLITGEWPAPINLPDRFCSRCD